MTTTRLLALVLIVTGALALAYGGFSYTKRTNQVDLGVVQFEVKEKERVNVPLWVGFLALGSGTALLLVGSKRG